MGPSVNFFPPYILIVFSHTHVIILVFSKDLITYVFKSNNCQIHLVYLSQKHTKSLQLLMVRVSSQDLIHKIKIIVRLIFIFWVKYLFSSYIKKKKLQLSLSLNILYYYPYFFIFYNNILTTIFLERLIT